MRKVKSIFSRKQKENMVTAIVRLTTEKEEEILKKEFQKMIHKCNHLLEKGISYELIVIRADEHNHQEGE